MPSVRNITITPTSLTFTDHRGVVKTFLASDIPQSANTAAKAENFANSWCAANVDGYQMRVHVFTLSPLLFTVGTWNIGETINANWWE